MTYEPWDVVLLPFPYKDLSARKKRPAVVLSPVEYNDGQDVILMYLTSKTEVTSRPGDHKLKEWKGAGLPKPSMTRMKMITLDKDHILKKIGCITDADQKAIKRKLKAFFGL